MIKPIKFDLKLNDGTPLRTLRDLQENLSPAVFEHFYSGKLAKWLRVRKLDEQAEKLEALLVAEKEHEAQLFKNMCEIFGHNYLNDDEAREAMQNYKKSNSPVENFDDEVEQLNAKLQNSDNEVERLKAENEELKREAEKHKSEISEFQLKSERQQSQILWLEKNLSKAKNESNSLGNAFTQQMKKLKAIQE